MSAVIVASVQLKAKRRAPKNLAIWANCSQVGSRAKLNACSIWPSGGEYLRGIGGSLRGVEDRGHAMGCAYGAAARAERGQSLRHVANEIVLHFGVVEHNETSSVGFK